jgi:hypothetical protein
MRIVSLVFVTVIAGASVRLLPPAAAGAADDWKLPPEKTVLKEGVGRELVIGQCLLCHSSDYISTQPPLTRAQWQAGIEKMRTKYGAPIATNSAPALLDYLTAAYGKAVPPK